MWQREEHQPPTTVSPATVDNVLEAQWREATLGRHSTLAFGFSLVPGPKSKGFHAPRPLRKALLL